MLLGKDMLQHCSKSITFNRTILYGAKNKALYNHEIFQLSTRMPKRVIVYSILPSESLIFESSKFQAQFKNYPTPI